MREKKRSKRCRSAVLAIALCAALLLGMVPMTETASAATRKTDVTTASDGNLLVGVKGTFNYLTKTKILARINEIRKEACEEGVPDPRDSDTALTEDDYVAIKWSGDLEWIAQTRAAEASVYQSHTRTNGKSWGTLEYNGTEADAEVLAWNTGAKILTGIEQWYDEKDDWVNQTSGAVTGHYTSMINPDITYVGIGAFQPNGGGWGCVAGEYSSASSLDTTQIGVSGSYKQMIEVSEDSLTLDPSTLTVEPTKTKTLNPNPSVCYESLYGTDKLTSIVLSGVSATYTVSDTSIAKINKNGVVTGKKVGTTTVKIKMGSLTAKTKIKVKVKKGSVYTVNGIKYKVTKTGSKAKNRTVTVTGTTKKKASVKSLTIPAKVKIGGVSYKVTKIGAKAFKKNTKLKKLTIKSTTITAVGKNALKGIKKNAVIKVPASKKSAYKALFTSKTGFTKKMKIKKI